MMQTPNFCLPGCPVTCCHCYCLQVRLSPSDILAGALALGLASYELASHHTSFTLNNMVRRPGGAVNMCAVCLEYEFSPGMMDLCVDAL